MIHKIVVLVLILLSLLVQDGFAQTGEQVLNSNLLITDTAYQSDIHSSYALLLGAFIGICSTILLGLTLTYGFNRDRLVLCEAATLLFMVMLTISLAPVGWLPEVDSTNNIWLYVFSLTAMSFATLCADKKLEYSFYDQRLKAAFKYFSLISLAIIPITLMLPDTLIGWVFVTTIVIYCCFQGFYTYMIWRDGLYHQQVFCYSFVATAPFIALAGVNSYAPNLLAVTNATLAMLAVVSHIGFIIMGIAKTYIIQPSEQQQEEALDKDLQLSEQMLELQLALKELQEKNEQLEKLNTLDELSGIHNRRYFDKRLLAELRRSRRELTPLSLIMFDIDHFKQFNDSYGHLAGDEVIRAVAVSTSEQLNRETDEVFRYGGEEYAIILPNTDLEGACYIAEKVRQAIESMAVSCNERQLRCTISLGVACHLSQRAIQPNEFIEQADKALYTAKQQGRNQVAQHT